MKSLFVVMLAELVFATVGVHAGQPPPGTVLWTYDLGAPATSPALWTDGTIYIGTLNGLYAITNSGSVASNKWVFSTPVRTSAAVGGDGTIYFGDGNGNLRALNPDGSQRWNLLLETPIQSCPLIGYDGSLYAVAGGKLYAISPSGATKWH